MKKLNPGYFEFFFFGYEIIVIAVHVVAISSYLCTKEKKELSEGFLRLKSKS